MVLHEAGGRRDVDALIHGGDGACRKLCEDLALLVGKKGIEAVFGRALARAQAKHVFLQGVQVAAKEGSCLTGLEGSATGRDAAAVEGGVVAILANALMLLDDLLGKELTLRALRRCWPGVSFAESDFAGGEEKR